MSDELESNPSGVAPDAPSGAPEASQDKVAYETYQKLLSEKKARDAQLAEYQRRFDEIEQQRRNETESKLKQKEDYQSLLKLREQELDEMRSKLSAKDSELGETKRTIESGVKLQSFLNALEGVVDRKYWSMIDLDSVLIDPTTGTPDPTSVKKSADLFAKSFPELVQKKSVPRPPGSAPQNNNGLSYEEWLKLPVDEMKKRQKDIV
jgi:hypothetical protein